MSARIGDLIKLDGPTLIALRGIIAVHRHLNALDDEPTQIVLEGGATILVSRLEGEFVRKQWEFWSACGTMGERWRVIVGGGASHDV